MSAPDTRPVTRRFVVSYSVLAVVLVTALVFADSWQAAFYLLVGVQVGIAAAVVAYETRLVRVADRSRDE